MLTEKEKNIVDAVNATQCEVNAIAPNNLLKWKRTINFHKEGEYTTGIRSDNSAYIEVICTIEEYNQCLEDMARASWLYKRNNKDVGYFNYSYYLEMCDKKGIDTSNKTLLKEDCYKRFYDKPLVYTQEMEDSQELPLTGMEFMYKLGYKDDSFLQKGFGVGFTQDGEWFVFHNEKNDVHIQNASNGANTFHKIKTPEQIQQEKEEAELQAAEHKQRKRVANILRTLPISASFDDAAEKLQRVGELAEILLPLEK